MTRLETTAFQEECANEFAMALLMPKEKFLEQVRLHTSPDGRTVNTKAIADHFGVAIDVAHMRGVSLGVLRQF